MKVGDLVKPKLEWAIEGIDYGVGVIIDCYLNNGDHDVDVWYYQISWKHETQWCVEGELELISEK